MEDRLGEGRVEARDVLDLAAHRVVAERDLALQPAGVGQVDRQRVVVVGLGLADVVEQRAGDGDLAVDAGEEVGGGADRLGDRERVLEQPVAVGLVVGLGGGRVERYGAVAAYLVRFAYCSHSVARNWVSLQFASSLLLESSQSKSTPRAAFALIEASVSIDASGIFCRVFAKYSSVPFLSRSSQSRSDYHCGEQ